MHITLLTQLFQPEPNFTKGLAFAKALKDTGIHVEVVTSFPNYPAGEIYEGYRWAFYRQDCLEGIVIHRLGHYISHNPSALSRIASHISFAIISTIFLALRPTRPSVLHVSQGPIAIALPAVILKWMKGVPFILDVGDIWPESLYASGMMDKYYFFNKFLKLWEKFNYNQATQLTVLSNGYLERIAERGISRDKIHLIYNWCEEDVLDCLPNNANSKNDQFNILYAGNMGPAQKLDTILYAARTLMNLKAPIQILLIGSGICQSSIIELQTKLALSNLKIMDRMPIADLSKYIQEADALLIHLGESDLSKITIPQKTQAYLCVGKPIIIGVNGEAGDLVVAANAGYKFSSGCPESLASCLLKFIELPFHERLEMGLCGNKYYKAEMSFSVGVRKTLKVIKLCTAGKEIHDYN